MAIAQMVLFEVWLGPPLNCNCVLVILPRLLLVVGESRALGGQSAHHFAPDEHCGDEHASGKERARFKANVVYKCSV